MSSIEAIAAGLLIINLYLLMRVNIFNWPVGMAGVALYGLVFYQAHLYSDMLLQACFFLLQIYGWYQWLYGGVNNKPLVISKIVRKNLPFWFVLAIVGTFSLGSIMHHLTQAQFVYMDAANTAISLIAQYWLAKKYIENWYLWMLVDVIGMANYIRKDLLITTVLNFILLLIAIAGYLRWRDLVNNQTNSPAFTSSIE